MNELQPSGTYVDLLRCRSYFLLRGVGLVVTGLGMQKPSACQRPRTRANAVMSNLETQKRMHSCCSC